MGKFLNNAKEMQLSSVTKEEAIANYRTSCRICTRRGINIECDRCPVKATHELMMSIYNDIEYAEKQKKLKKAEEELRGAEENLKGYIEVVQSCFRHVTPDELDDMESVICDLAKRYIALYEQKQKLL